jgi:hypothetical protein
VLATGTNRLILVLSGIASVVVSFLTYYAVWFCMLAFRMLPGGKIADTFLAWFVMHLLILVLFWLLAMPLWLGTYRLAIRMVDGETVDGREFFHYVTGSDRYGRALGISARLIARWLPAFLGYVVMQAFFDYDLIGLLLVLLFVITILLSLLLVGGLGGFVTMALTEEHLSPDRAQKLAARILEGERMCDFGFHLDMAWRMLVSLALAGIPLMLHTLPASMLSAACYARRLAVRDDL